MHQCRIYPPCIALAPEQWNLSEAGESDETSGTKGYGVHHYLHEPRDSGTLEPAPVMDIVVSRQRHSTSLAGGQPDRA